ncbi:MAG: ubiquitin-like domain-containing protein [Holophagaceae bacterium]|nr:ubiquitin-like domain-containing protein [Holophagaceae bacterium]
MKAIYALCLIAAFSVAGVAQERQGGGRQMTPYDASKEETIKAKVTNVAEQTRGPMSIVTLRVTVDGKEFLVSTASADFLKEKGFSFAKDDEVTIKGVKQDAPQGGTMIRAREITKGEKALELLDKEGRPVWRPAGGPGGGGGNR